MRRAPLHQISISDRAGVRLNIVWSRSGKTIGVAILMGPRVAQSGLTASQAVELGRYLADEPEPYSALELEYPEVADARVEAAWNPSGSHLSITLLPATPWAGDPPQATLAKDEVSALARFLIAGSPSPA